MGATGLRRHLSRRRQSRHWSIGSTEPPGRAGQRVDQPNDDRALAWRGRAGVEQAQQVETTIEPISLEFDQRQLADRIKEIHGVLVFILHLLQYPPNGEAFE